MPSLPISAACLKREIAVVFVLYPEAQRIVLGLVKHFNVV